VAVVLVVIAVIVVAILVAVAVTRSRRAADGVEGFRRHIDALSSDARRPTIDRGLGDDDAVAGEVDGDDASGGTDAAGGTDDGA
jgi:hypothetical protein